MDSSEFKMGAGFPKAIWCYLQTGFVWVWSLSFPLLPGPLWSRVVVPVRVPSMGQIDLFESYLYPIVMCYHIAVLTNDCWLELILDWNTWNHITNYLY